MANYAIFRAVKHQHRDHSQATKSAAKSASNSKKGTTTRSVQGALDHLFREINTPNADPNKTPSNIILKGGSNVAEIMADFDELMPKKVRSNAVKAVEFVVTGSPEKINAMTENEKLDYFKQSVKFIGDKFGGQQNVLSAIIHNDEKTPHLSVVLVPLVNGKLNASKFLDGPNKLKELQSDFASEVGAKFGLSRGVERARPRNHIETQTFYKVIDDIQKQLKKDPRDIDTLSRLIKQIDYQRSLGEIKGGLENANQKAIIEQVSNLVDEKFGNDKGVLFDKKITTSEAKEKAIELFKNVLSNYASAYESEERAKRGDIDDFERNSIKRITEKKNALEGERMALEREREKLEKERANTREKIRQEMIADQDTKVGKLLAFWEFGGKNAKSVDEFNELLSENLSRDRQKISSLENDNKKLETENERLKEELRTATEKSELLEEKLNNAEFLKEKYNEIKKAEEQFNREQEQLKEKAKSVQENKRISMPRPF